LKEAAVVWQGNCFMGIESEHYAIRRFCFGRVVSDIAIALSNDTTRKRLPLAASFKSACDQRPSRPALGRETPDP
jgi:hypothetical protein